LEPNTPHLTTRVILTRELNILKESVISIGYDCCQLLALTVTSFSIYEDFIEVHVKELYNKIYFSADQLENRSLTVLSLQQPLLKDLRLVIGVLRISTQLTRLASYAARLVNIAGSTPNKAAIPSELITIAENCQLLLTDLLKAFDTGSISMALDLIKKEKQIDLLYDSSFQKIIKRMNSEGVLLQQEAQMLTSARFLERIGDTLASIAKEVYFIYSGQKYSIEY
jgi:phosphate transport system protein